MLFTEKGSVAKFGKWQLLRLRIDNNKLIYKHLPIMPTLANPANNPDSIDYIISIKYLAKMPISANWLNDNFSNITH